MDKSALKPIYCSESECGRVIGYQDAVGTVSLKCKCGTVTTITIPDENTKPERRDLNVKLKAAK